MANKDQLSSSVVDEGLKYHAKSVLDAVDAAARFANNLTDAQDGETTAVWSRTLESTANTGKVTLTVDATAKTVSCLANAGLFANFRVGRDANMSLFTNAGNNGAFEIIAVTPDMITLDQSATGLVNETDTTSRVVENTTSDEKDKTDARIVAKDRLLEMQNALDNSEVPTADRRADLTDWIW